MSTPNDHAQPWIFLCHASEDKPQVANLYRRLKDAGYHPWLDKYDLLPGQDWWQEIEKIIRSPFNLVLVCLSNNSISKRGVVQREIKRALDVLDEMPESTIYLIPARLEPCEVPERLSRLHWVNLFEPDGFEYLLRALDYELGKRQSMPEPVPVTPAEVALANPPQPKLAEQSPAPAIPRVVTPAKPKPTKPAKKQEAFEPELILIPAGEFLMGSDPKKDKDASRNEQPQHTLYLPNYYIAKTSVTNTQYAAFVQATRYKPRADWQGKELLLGKENHPVVNVSWEDVMAYCHWLAQVTGKTYRLPTEAEWEKASRGTDGRIYPWGDKWDAKRCNTREGNKGKTILGTMPVFAYSKGASPYGVLGMAGNVWEWCATKWGKSYPYDVAEDEWNDDYLGSSGHRVLRGGAFLDFASQARCANRLKYTPDGRYNARGFRVAASPSQ